MTFEMFDVSADAYPELCKRVIDRFGLARASELIVGPSVLFWDYRAGNATVELAWDNWTGFTVVAKDPESEQLVRDIGEFLLKGQ